MSSRTPNRLIVLTLVAALVIGVGAHGVAGVRADPAAPHVAKHHKKKKTRKAVRCRKSQVSIKVKRRTVGCRSLRAALPAPRSPTDRGT